MIAIGVTGLFSVILSVRGLWSVPVVDCQRSVKSSSLGGLSLNPKDVAPTIPRKARVAEPADARDLGSRGETREGSSPSSRTRIRNHPGLASLGARGEGENPH